MEEYRIYRGARGGSSIAFDRIFFYHIPKTAGTSIYMAIKASSTIFFQQVRNSIPGFKPPFISRVDTPFDQAPQNIDYGFIASHLPFGTHNKIPSSFQLMTLFRDPVQRVKSAYLYECLRQDKQVSNSNFEGFFRREENQNFMCRHLGFQGNAPLGEITAQLEEKFALIDIDKNADQVIEDLLSYNCLPNMIMKKLNKSKGAERLQLEDHQQEILSLNDTDLNIYDYFCSNRKRFPQSNGSSSHPVTLLIEETKNKELTVGQIYLSRVDLESEFSGQKTIPETTFNQLKSSAMDITDKMHAWDKMQELALEG